MVEKKTLLILALVAVIAGLLSALLWYVFRGTDSNGTDTVPTAPAEKTDTYENEKSDTPARAGPEHVTAYVSSGLLTDDSPDDDSGSGTKTRAILIEEEEPSDVADIVEALDRHEHDPGMSFSNTNSPTSSGSDDSVPGLVTERRNSTFLTYEGAKPKDIDHCKFRVMGVAGNKQKTYVFGMRDRTGFYSIIKRVRIPFHSLFATEKTLGGDADKAALVVGETGLPDAKSEPPFLFDSSETRMLMPDVYLDANKIPVGRTNVELMITARYIEYEFIIHGSAYVIRVLVCPMPGDSGKYGDLMIDTGDGEFMWYDKDGKFFCSDRPENPCRLVDHLTFADLDEIYTRSAENVLPIPVHLLTSPIDWDAIRETEGNLNVLIELTTDTVLMFSRTPPAANNEDINMHEWIIDHVAFPALTSNIMAVIKLER